MKNLVLLLLVPTFLLCSCGPSSSSSSASHQKGEEIVTTIEKESFEKLITNAELVNTLQANFTLKYEDSAGQTSLIKFDTYAVEFDMLYPGGSEPAPVKYYSIDLEKASLTLVNPASGQIVSYLDMTHDDAMKDIMDAVGIVGSGFVYESFSYVSASKSYHADAATSSSGNGLSNVDFYFENGHLVKVTASEKAIEGDLSFQLLAYDYGQTKVKIPY